MEGKKVVQPPREELGFLFLGSQLPSSYLHQLRRYGPEYSDCDVDRIDDHQIWIDQEVSADIGHETSPLLAELLHQSCADPGHFFLVLFPKERAPTSNRTASYPVMFLNCMTIAQGPGRPAECGLHRTGFYPQAGDIFEVGLVSRLDMVSVQAVLDQ